MQLDSIEPCVTEAPPLPPPPPPDAEELAAQPKRHWTPLGNSWCLVRTFGDAFFRFIVETGLWIVWASGRWRQDTANIRMHRMCKATLAHMLKHPDCSPDLLPDYKKWIKRSETGPMFEQMLLLARSDRNIAISFNQLDQHPDYLCCEDWVVDLRTGERFPNRPDLYLIKNTNVPYVPDAAFQPWEAFLDEITGGNRAIRNFIQALFGYTLQGSTKEEKLFILHGPGGTGKSTVLEAVSGASGEYHVAAAFSTFLKKDRVSSGPSEDIARLAGARLITASEVDDGQRFAEGTLKQLTGGDAVSARFLYQNSFDFRMTGKLVIACNHLPFMQTDDNAIWRRVVRVPCEQLPSQLQTNLKSLFATPEAKIAILAWMVKGAAEWYRNGLVIPQEIQTATACAREEMDPVAAFISEECITDPRCLNGVTQFRKSYEVWAQANGQRYTLDRRRFNRALKAKGFEQGVRKVNNAKARCWLGIHWVGQNEEQRERIQAELYRDRNQGLFKQ